MKLFFLLSFIFGIVLCLSPKPGSQIRLRTDALNSAARSLIDAINALGNNIQVPDQTTGWRFIHVTLSSITIKNLNIDPNQLSITTDNSIDVQCNSLSVAVSFHYKIKISKHGPHKSGDCDASIDGSSANIKFGISQQNSHPLLSLLEKSANINDLNYHCRGGWLSHLMNIGKLIPKLSNKLLEIPIERELGGKLAGTFVNYGLASSPQFSPQQMIIPLITQFWYQGHKNDNPATVFPSSQPYPSNVPPQMFCVDIDSNLAARSAIYAFNVSDKSSFSIGDSIFKRLSAEKQKFFDCDCSGGNCLISKIPELSKQCEKGKKFGIHGIAKIGGDIYVNNSGIILFSDASFDFKLGNGDGQENGPSLLSIKANLDVLLEKSVKIQNWILFGKIDILQTSLSANTTLGPILPNVINDIWNFVMKDIVEIVANDALSTGIPLPPLNFISFKNVNLKFDSPIIEACSDVDFDFKQLLS